MSIEVPFVYLPSSMNLVIKKRSYNSAKDVELLDLNAYWLSLNGTCWSIYVFNLL